MKMKRPEGWAATSTLKAGHKTHFPQPQPISMFMIIINDERSRCLASVRCSITFYEGVNIIPHIYIYMYECWKKLQV